MELLPGHSTGNPPAEPGGPYDYSAEARRVAAEDAMLDQGRATQRPGSQGSLTDEKRQNLQIPPSGTMPDPKRLTEPPSDPRSLE